MNHSSADVLQFGRRVVRLHKVDKCFYKPVRSTPATQQVVDVVQALGQVVLLASGAAARNSDHPTVAEARKLGAARAGFEPGLVRDLPRGRRLPKRGERKVNTAFLPRERFEVALEVLRVVVDQIEQMRHEIAERQSSPEAGYDREQPRASAGKDLQRTNGWWCWTAAGHGLPQDRALVRVEGAQRADPEEVVQGAVRVVDLVEAAGCAREHDDPRLGLQDLSQPPPRVPIGHIPEQHVQVLDQQHEALAVPIGEVQQRAETTIGQLLVVADCAQLLDRAVQIGGVFPARGLSCQIGETLQPELTCRPDLVALLREGDREIARRQRRVPPCFRRDAQKQARLPAAARADHDLVRVRVSGALAQNLDEHLELRRSHAVRPHELIVGEKPRVELARGRGHRVMHPAIRSDAR